MEPISPPQTVKVYQLLKRSGLSLSNVGATSSMSFGYGFYLSLQEAEQNCTMEILKNTDAVKPEYYIFELDIPNPIYQDQK